jgi:N-acetylglucosamine kinase-like BadF-type ATPase
MPYFLAVDAGGTKTEFALADERRELVRLRTGAIQRQRVDEETATQTLRDALNELTAHTGVAMTSIHRTCVGTSGETVPLIAAWLRKAFGESVGGELILLGDVEIALDACFLGARGILVMAGTGSNAAGRASSGELLTAGGWGPVLADQGSGQFLGVEALRQGFLAIDQDEPRRRTRLLDLALQHWNLASINELIEFANSNPRPNFTTFAPLVAQAAAEGDVVAAEILAQGGHDLAYLASLLIERIRKLEPAQSEFHPPEIAITGSVLSGVAPLRAAFTRSLRSSYPNIQIAEAPADPIAGALWRARLGR